VSSEVWFNAESYPQGITRRVGLDGGLQHQWYLQGLRNREVWWSSNSQDDRRALKFRNLGHEVEVGTRSRHKRRGAERRTMQVTLVRKATMNKDMIGRCSEARRIKVGRERVWSWYCINM